MREVFEELANIVALALFMGSAIVWMAVWGTM